MQSFKAIKAIKLMQKKGNQDSQRSTAKCSPTQPPMYPLGPPPPPTALAVMLRPQIKQISSTVHSKEIPCILGSIFGLSRFLPQYDPSLSFWQSPQLAQGYWELFSVSSPSSLY